MGCHHSTVVPATTAEVWKTIRNFHDLSWGEPVITSVEAVGQIAGDQVGAKRILNSAFHETLTALDDEHQLFTYTIDDGPGPVSKNSVSGYIGTVRLHPVTDDNTTLVEWKSEYESSEPNAVADFCNPIYVGLLAALKDHFGS